MTNRRTLLVFGVIALAQLAATTSSIALYESTLRTGEPMRFRLAPVDPVDPLRGYYAALRFEAATTHVVPDDDVRVGASCYAVLEVGGDGFARVTRVVSDRPRAGRSIRVTLLSPGDASIATVLGFPFDRFYAERSTAASIDRAFFRAGGAPDAYAIVRVGRGLGVLESLVVDGRDVSTGRPIAPR